VSPLASGIDVVPALIEFATGRRKEFQIDKSKVLNRGAGNIYFYLPEGTVSRIKGIDEIKSMPGIHKVALDDLFPGRKIEPLRNLSGRQGPIVYAGEDRGACEEIIEKVKAVLRVEVQTPEGIRGMVWS
jgi:hypothetical protein